MTTDLRFAKTETGRYYAKGAAHTYLVVRDATNRWWELTVFTKATVAGVEISGREIDGFGCDTKTMACLVAREFEALGEDYKPHEHGHRGRLCEAVGRAYRRDASKGVSVNQKEAAETLALAVVSTVHQKPEMVTVALVEEIANQWLHDYPEGTERRAVAEIVRETGARPAYRLAAKRLRDDGKAYLLGDGLHPRQKLTAQQFAAELERAGARIKWLGERSFRADNRRQMGNRRSVRVDFYSDVDQFSHAYASSQRLRSMAAVRRHLGFPVGDDQ